jgi:hypothetical protein
MDARAMRGFVLRELGMVVFTAKLDDVSSVRAGGVVVAVAMTVSVTMSVAVAMAVVVAVMMGVRLRTRGRRTGFTLAAACESNEAHGE